MGAHITPIPHHINPSSAFRINFKPKPFENKVGERNPISIIILKTVKLTEIFLTPFSTKI
jgi:hypothetical protein